MWMGRASDGRSLTNLGRRSQAESKAHSEKPKYDHSQAPDGEYKAAISGDAEQPGSLEAICLRALRQSSSVARVDSGPVSWYWYWYWYWYW